MCTPGEIQSCADWHAVYSNPEFLFKAADLPPLSLAAVSCIRMQHNSLLTQKSVPIVVVIYMFKYQAEVEDRQSISSTGAFKHVCILINSHKFNLFLFVCKTS